MKFKISISSEDMRMPLPWDDFVANWHELLGIEPNSKALLDEVGRNPGTAIEIYRRLISPRPKKGQTKGGAPTKWDEWNVLRAWVLVSVEREMEALEGQNSRIGVKTAMEQCFKKRRGRPIELSISPAVVIHSADHAKRLHDEGAKILRMSPQKGEMWQAIRASELRHAQRQYTSKN